jgi:hypothetical protein
MHIIYLGLFPVSSFLTSVGDILVFLYCAHKKRVERKDTDNVFKCHKVDTRSYLLSNLVLHIKQELFHILSLFSNKNYYHTSIL